MQFEGYGNRGATFRSGCPEKKAFVCKEAPMCSPPPVPAVTVSCPQPAPVAPVVCATTVQPTCATGSNDMGCWAWLGSAVLTFIVLTVIFWLIYYSLHPSFVTTPGIGAFDVDTAKVLLAAVLSALILLIIIWLIWALCRRC